MALTISSKWKLSSGKHPSAGDSGSCDLQSLLIRGPVPQLCSNAYERLRPPLDCNLLKEETQYLPPSHLPPPGSAFTGKGTYVAPIPDQTRSSRKGTRCSYRHVGPCAHEGVGHGVDELPANPKVTEVDFPTRVH